MEFFSVEADKEKYLKWREAYPNGFVLNINTLDPESKRYKNLIHLAAGCQSLNVPPAKNQERPVTPAHPKYCSTDINEIITEMKTQRLFRTVHPCWNCQLKYRDFFFLANQIEWAHPVGTKKTTTVGSLLVN